MNDDSGAGQFPKSLFFFLEGLHHGDSEHEWSTLNIGWMAS
jgi:hypothetical protein